MSHFAPHLTSTAQYCANPSDICCLSVERRLKTRALSALLFGSILTSQIFVFGVNSSLADDNTRTLWLHFTHTGEEKRITFRRNGQYDGQGIKELQWILRDWRQNETTKMDPRLFDLIWSVYQESGATQAIHVVSGYRSLKTNNALRRRSRGVARRSQHTAGKAIDFYIPGVPVSRLREIGLKLHAGGVGFYPSSGSPFVHMDTGRVRHWPRLTPKQLAHLFPNGKTMHVSTNGRKLAGYSQAFAEYTANQSEIIQPLTESKRTRLAASASEERSGRGRLRRLFRRNRPDKPQTVAPIVVASKVEKEPVIVANQLLGNKNGSLTSGTERIKEKEAVIAAESAGFATLNVPAPRAVPESLRGGFGGNNQAIRVAQAPQPAIRPAYQNNATHLAAIVQPQIVSANTDRLAYKPATVIEGQPSAGVPSSSAEAKSQAGTPSLVKKPSTVIGDPTRLVLNESKQKKIKLPKSRTALAYALPEQNLVSPGKISNQSFNDRFEGLSSNITATKSVPLRPTIKATTRWARGSKEWRQPGTRSASFDRFAAFDINNKMPSLDVRDLGLSPETHAWFARHKAVFNKNDVSDKLRQSYLPYQSSLTNMAIDLEFYGKKPGLLSTMLATGSLIRRTVASFDLPEPDKVPDLFQSPDRVYSGGFTYSSSKMLVVSRFKGEVLSITSTRDYHGEAGSRIKKL